MIKQIEDIVITLIVVAGIVLAAWIVVRPELKPEPKLIQQCDLSKFTVGQTYRVGESEWILSDIQRYQERIQLYFVK